MNLIIFCILLALNTVLCSKRLRMLSKEEDERPRKRTKLMVTEMTGFELACIRGDLEIFANANLAHKFRHSRHTDLRQRCMKMALKNLKLGAVDKLMSFPVDINFSLIFRLIKTGNPDFLLLFLARKPRTILRLLEKNSNPFSTLVHLYCPSLIRQLLPMVSMTSFKHYLDTSFHAEDLAVFAETVAFIPYDLRRHVLLNYLHLACNDDMKYAMIILILGNIHDITADELAKYSKAALAYVIMEKLRTRNHNDLLSMLQGNDKFTTSIIFAAAYWLADAHLISVASHFVTHRYIVRKCLKLACLNRNLQTIPSIVEMQSENFGALEFHHFRALIRDQIYHGRYSSLRGIFKAMPKGWKRKFIKEFPRGTKTRVILQLVCQIEMNALNMF